MKKFFLISSIALAFIFSGCGPTAVVVRTRPEPPVLVRTISPGAGYIWVDGEWFWRNNEYVYRPGYWATPRHRNAIWVSGHWRAGRGGWYWVPGHWK